MNITNEVAKMIEDVFAEIAKVPSVEIKPISVEEFLQILEGGETPQGEKGTICSDCVAKNGFADFNTAFLKGVEIGKKTNEKMLQDLEKSLAEKIREAILDCMELQNEGFEFEIESVSLEIEEDFELGQVRSLLTVVKKDVAYF